MRWTLMLLIAAAPQAWAQTLSYDEFKRSVQPIFLEKRAGHTRCYVCHNAERSNSALRLAMLSPGAKSWNEAQSKQNFETVARLVTPGKPEASLLLLHPLAPEAGGDAYHSGGRQFENRDDPDWKRLERWVRGG